MDIISHKLENIDITFNGDHTGLGAIDFSPVQVVSMGPHYFPLGEASRFGIYRKGGDFSDVEISLDQISGWTKLIACDRSFGSGSTWLYFSAQKNQSSISLSLSFENGKGEEIRVHGKRYQKGALSGYQGLSGLTDLVSSNKKISMQANAKAPMHIIPLAGGDFFWGADFLIAYEIHDLAMRYQWSFTESI
jgi:hypothetical protein